MERKKNQTLLRIHYLYFFEESNDSGYHLTVYEVSLLVTSQNVRLFISVWNNLEFKMNKISLEMHSLDVSEKACFINKM